MTGAWDGGCPDCRHSDGYREGRCEWIDASGASHVVIRRAPCSCPYGAMLRTLQGRDGKESPPLDWERQAERWRLAAERNRAIVRSIDWTGQAMRQPPVGWADSLEMAAARPVREVT